MRRAVGVARGRRLGVPPLPALSHDEPGERLRYALRGFARSPGFTLVAVLSLALVLTAVGVYGVMAYLVTERTRDIGIRIALGATERAVLGMVLGQAAAVAVGGAAIGVGAALALSRVLQSLLFEVRGTDPIMAVTVLLLAVALVATYLPARRAMRMDPVTALRTE